MPRPKKQTVYALPGTTLNRATKTLQPSINALLTVANEQPGGLQDRALEALSAGRLRGFHAWPAWAAVALVNLHSNIQTGDYHLRRCSRCGLWMIVKDERHHVCVRAACKRASKTHQQAARRQALRELDAGAISRAKRTF